MRTILKLSFLLACIVFLSNCKKEETESFVNEINVTIKNSDNYELDFMISGDEEGAIIKTQASNMEISELVRDSSTNWNVVYHYKPLAHYIGTDYVEIETCTGGSSTGCSNIETVRINFTITN